MLSHFDTADAAGGAAVSFARRSLRKILPDGDLGIASTKNTVFILL